MRNHLFAAIIVSCFLYSAALADDKKSPTTQPVPTVGRDTTYLTGPLRPDGTVDYLAAINEQYSKGVTRNNNAAVLLLQVFDPNTFLDDSIRSQVFKKLGIAPPKGPFLTFPERGTALGEAFFDSIDKLWTAEEHPELAAWLKENKALLDKIVVATKRPRYYIPQCTPKPNDPLIAATLPFLGQYRNAARALTVRANLAMAQGHYAKAWADIMANYRFGSLMNQSSTLVGRLVGIAISNLSLNAMSRLASTSRLTTDQAMSFLAALNAAGPTPTVATAFNTERYFVLDCITRMLRNPKESPEIFAALFGDNPGQDVDDWQGFIVLLENLPPETLDTLLQRTNEIYDKMVKTCALPAYAEKTRAWKSVSDEILRIKTGMGNPNSLANAKPQERMRRTSNLLLSLFLTNFDLASMLSDRIAMRRDLAAIALALAAYNADNGRYPKALASLTPKYLKKIPKDRFSDKPLIYKPAADGKGYTLYSVGDNAKDDGGEGKDEAEAGLVVKVGG